MQRVLNGVPLAAGRRSHDLKFWVGFALTWFMAASANAQAAPDAAACAALVGMQVESGVVTTTTWLPQGTSITGAGGAFGGDTTTVISTNLCRAKMVLTPTSSSTINVETWLPTTWNGKMFGYGGGGFSGGLGQSAALMNTSAAQGYASTTSDIGHPSNTSAQWAQNQPEKIIDFGHRANHLMAVAAKQVMLSYYQRAVQRAYFQGCSGGGREAMMEVSRYPNDYDGVIAGAPAMSWGQIMALNVWTTNLNWTASGLFLKYPQVTQGVMKACDKQDGVQDNTLENAGACGFDPAVLQCLIGDFPTCLSQKEVGVMRKRYEGPRLATGELVIPGLAKGSEGGWTTADTLNTLGGGQEYFRWMVYNNPNWSSNNFILDYDVPNSRATIEPIVNSDNPDIRPFIQRGGKLIMYHGWADQMIPSANSVRYFEQARNIVGSGLSNNARLFMVPGGEHCAAGFDMVPHLEAWVEQGQAPDRVIRTTTTSTLFGTTTTTHPLCPWPKVAKYNGSGSTSDAANYSCAAQ